jgi:type I restriction enzyme S subunit
MDRPETLLNGWSFVKLSKIIQDLPSGVSVNGDDRSADPSEAGVLKVSSVSNGRFFPSENKVISGTEVERARMPVSRGDLLISRSNTFDLVGASGMVKENAPNLYLPDKLWKVVLKDPTKDNLEWLLQLLNSSSMRQSLKNIATGTSGSMKNISKPSFLSIRVLRPTFPEQKKIAAILSTWDRAIELTEKLIATKQKRKQALMQQLLTGKVRLPGFETTTWKSCHLGDVAKNSTRRNGASTEQSIVYSVTNSVGMIPMDEGVIGESIERYKTVSRFDFAYNPMRINVGSIAMWNGDEDVLVSPDYVVFQCGPKLDAEFLEHFRKTHYWSHFVTRAGGGSVRVRIYFKDLAAMKLNLPPLEEQKAITSVLNTQNKELKLLEAKRDYLRELKKGLMQQLLTGKVRVNVEAETVKG